MKTNEMKRCCACFTTDLGYAFPTLLSAIQARRYLRAGHADVIIILFHDGAAIDDTFAKICAQKGIELITAPLQILQGYTPMYARLFLNDLLPEVYQRILYIDGDTQIHGDLDALVQVDFADSAFLAAADPMAILAAAGGPRAAVFSRYFAALGVNNTPASPYFNSGVLLVNRSSWPAICRDALSFLKNHPESCLFQDQSALNFAGHKYMVAMSLQWNFPIFFRNCGVERQIAPRLYHFMAKPKPWNAALPPWNQRFSAPYEELKQQFPALAKYAPPLRRKTYLRYLGQQNLKRIQETLAWRIGARRAAILRFHQAANI